MNTTSDELRLKKAGWKKTRKGWKSPHSGIVWPDMEKAVRCELMRERENEDQNIERIKAAAPELLEALKDAQKCIRAWPNEWQVAVPGIAGIINRAIKKATEGAQ